MDVDFELCYLERLAERDFGKHCDFKAWSDYVLRRAEYVQQAIGCLTTFADLKPRTQVAKACRLQAAIYQERLIAVRMTFVL